MLTMLSMLSLASARAAGTGDSKQRFSQASEATMSDPWEMQMEALGAFIRSTRKNANLSLRQLAEMTRLSNPYLSQIERGLHQPSVRVIRLISDALNISAESLLIQAGLLHATESGEDAGPAAGVSAEAAIQADERLTPEQKKALIAVYNSMRRPD